MFKFIGLPSPEAQEILGAGSIRIKLLQSPLLSTNAEIKTALLIE
jgi:hypothetical protein